MSIDKRRLGNFFTIYGVIFLGVWLCLSLWSPRGGYIWDPLFINVSTSLLFTLLVALTGRLLGTDHTFLGMLFTAVFLIVFYPGASGYFNRDEVSLLELASQCIVPFFIMQYETVSRKNFGKLYFLMLFMGVFCSYTHNTITIPLCATFVWLSFLRRRQFFRRACWPMVVGFVIGTGLSIWKVRSSGEEPITPLADVTAATSVVFHILWDTKVFVFSTALTAYLALAKNGRKIIAHLARRQYVLSYCLLMAILPLPFAPLGIDNAVAGVCFFSMLWSLSLCKYLVFIYFNKRL
ncbi:MAG: hypothetical protein LUC44_03305 [Prevotellaceae bacterium]|nr:hypothetical protein [Prevotellaceae bacterium]